MTVCYLGDQVNVEPAPFLHQLSIAYLFLGRLWLALICLRLFFFFLGGLYHWTNASVSWFEPTHQGKDMKVSLQTASNDKSQFIQGDNYKAECNPAGSSKSSQGAERFANWNRMLQISLHLWHLFWLFFLSSLLCFFFFGTWRRKPWKYSKSRIQVRSHKQVLQEVRLTCWFCLWWLLYSIFISCVWRSGAWRFLRFLVFFTEIRSVVKRVTQKQLSGPADNKQAWRFTWWSRTPAGSWQMQSPDLTGR